MELLLRREKSDSRCTIGALHVIFAAQPQFWMWTLEDVVRPYKIAGETAIPAGRYRIALQDSPHFGKDTLTILDVPGYGFIRIHAGNSADDTEGCLLVGFVRATDFIGESRAALEQLREHLVPTIKEGEQVWITIQDAA